LGGVVSKNLKRARPDQCCHLKGADKDQKERCEIGGTKKKDAGDFKRGKGKYEPHSSKAEVGSGGVSRLLDMKSKIETQEEKKNRKFWGKKKMDRGRPVLGHE